VLNVASARILLLQHLSRVCHARQQVTLLPLLQYSLVVVIVALWCCDALYSCYRYGRASANSSDPVPDAGQCQTRKVGSSDNLALLGLIAIAPAIGIALFLYKYRRRSWQDEMAERQSSRPPLIDRPSTAESSSSSGVHRTPSSGSVPAPPSRLNSPPSYASGGAMPYGRTVGRVFDSWCGA